MTRCIALIGLLLVSTATVPANAAAPACPAGAVRTEHPAAGTPASAYVACVGTLPVTNGAGAHGRIFYTAYLRKGANRPLAFIWNGGPGGDSRLLHFSALGPMLIRDGVLVENAASPLSAADLVFVDPVGTGFSRGATEADAKGFYSTMADIAATADFIGAFRRATDREASALYLLGESFGTWRATGAAERLLDHGVPVAGVALISGGIPLGDLPDRNRMRALALPNRTATAFALGKLPPDLQKNRAAALLRAQEFAVKTYAPALAAPETLSADQRARIVQELASLQGLDPRLIDDKTLWVSPRDFRKGLLAAEGKVLDVFDMRKSSPAPDDAANGRAAIGWYRNQLGFTGGVYAGIEGPKLPVGENWAYDQSSITPESLARAMAGEGPPSASRPWALSIMQKAQSLRTFVATGIYDSLNGCSANRATVAALPPDVARRFTLRCYEGGHMMYEEPGTLERFNDDIAAFLGGR